jgi:hypothetical protein
LENLVGHVWRLWTQELPLYIVLVALLTSLLSSHCRSSHGKHFSFKSEELTVSYESQCVGRRGTPATHFKGRCEIFRGLGDGNQGVLV